MYKLLFTLCAAVVVASPTMALKRVSDSIRTETITYDSPKTVFQVNKTTLGHPLEAPEIPDPTFWNYYRIVVEGTASPEGPTSNNERLARGRARLLSDSIKSWWRGCIPGIDTLITERIIVEDYAGLRRLMESSNESYRQSVIDIIDFNDGDMAATKRALKAHDKGRTWSELLKKYFPQLRYANVYIEGRHQKSQRIVIAPPALIKDNGTIVIDTLLWAQNFKPLKLESRFLSTKDVIRKRGAIINFKTNLLYDLPLITPNLSVEVLRLHPHLTPVIEGMWAGWRSDSRQRTWIIRSLLAECRYYLKGNGQGQYTGHYFSAYANTGKYDLQFGANKGFLSKRWNKTYGCGIGWGYVHRIRSSRWKLEANAAIGWLRTRYDRYHAAEQWATPGEHYYNWHNPPQDYRRYMNKLNYFGITRLGISISYDL